MNLQHQSSFMIQDLLCLLFQIVDESSFELSIHREIFIQKRHSPRSCNLAIFPESCFNDDLIVQKKKKKK